MTPQTYQLNEHIYLYNRIFTTLLLHVAVCQTPSAGRAIRISAQNHIFFARLLAYIENSLVENMWFWTEIRVPSLKMVYGTPKHGGELW
jgi:hypothetical protein